MHDDDDGRGLRSPSKRRRSGMRTMVRMSAFPPPIVLDPATVIEEGALWTIALNSNQNLLGKTMLALHRQCGSVADLTGEEWTDAHRQIRRICNAVDALFAPDLYNHCFLMTSIVRFTCTSCLATRGSASGTGRPSPIRIGAPCSDASKICCRRSAFARWLPRSDRDSRTSSHRSMSPK